MKYRHWLSQLDTMPHRHALVRAYLQELRRIESRRERWRTTRQYLGLGLMALAVVLALATMIILIAVLANSQ